VTGLQSDVEWCDKKKPPWSFGAAEALPEKPGRASATTFQETRTKKKGAVRRAVLVAAPQRAGERLGDDLCDAFIQNAEGKGLGWPLFGRQVLP